MKKCFYSLFAVAVFALTSAQQTVSFETSEGYTLSSIIGQNGWSAFNSLPATAVSVTNNEASNGTQSLWLNNTGLTTADGVIKNMGTFPNNFELSFDVKNGGGAELQFGVQSANQLALISGFLISSTGQFQYINELGNLVPTTDIIPNATWTNFKMKVNNTGNSITYYINNVQVGTTPTLTTTPAGIFGLTIDIGSNGMYLDNIRIVDTDLLSVTEVKTNSEIKVYPNPTNDFISINTSDKIVSFELYSATGQLMKSEKSENKIDVRNLKTGIYTLKINTNKGTSTHKVSIK